MASFTHYWEGNTCDLLFEDGHEGKPLVHTAGKAFTSRGVGVGDKVYVVNITSGVLYLVGRLEVAKIVSMSEAERLMGGDVWDAPEHLIARQGSSTPMHFGQIVPLKITKALLFDGSKGYQPLKFVSEEILDRQTLRGVRRLTDSSALLLEKILR